MARALAILLAAASLAPAEEAYERLIYRAVADEGVDYELLRGERALLSGMVEAQEFSQLTTAGRINYTNARVLLGVLDGKTPKEACKVLDEFKFSDSRIHFALHRAARSSPKLRYFKDNTLDGDLDEAVRVFLNDKRHNEFSEARLDAELSAIFVWHKDAFVPYQAFLAEYAPKASLSRRLKGSRWHFTVRKFDWRLNGLGGVEEESEGGSPLLWVYVVPAALLLAYGLYSFRALLWRKT